MFKPKGTVFKLVIFVIFVIISGLLFKQFSLEKKSEFEEQKSVPNIVHFVILLENPEKEATIDFIGATCILAAFINQSPEKILIHTNAINITGKYWTILTSVIGGKIQTNSIKKPTHVFGAPLSSLYHAADIVRIKTLIEYGGIFLDLDTFLGNYESTLVFLINMHARLFFSQLFSSLHALIRVRFT